ncbi:hypothetical protein Ddye_032498 [Dipteronia dyeriana]|uniref:Uncharacterized protein n=1 Tax=Dipteronia dyeriana TaxID=168575 RepID=A0AAD9TCX2_9ROSI|nr:hypothetical protein Ddye_032498 [Dipteronia dyeriana]
MKKNQSYRKFLLSNRVVLYFYVLDTIPFLGWLDVVKGYISKMKKTTKELDSGIENWVDKHHQRKLIRDVCDLEEHNFIHVLLSTIDDDKISAHQDVNTTTGEIWLKEVSRDLAHASNATLDTGKAASHICIGYGLRHSS